MPLAAMKRTPKMSATSDANFRSLFCKASASWSSRGGPWRPVTYSAQPGDGVKTLIPVLGPYDDFAIEWGYVIAFAFFIAMMFWRPQGMFRK